jgi:TetR/AcrR family transcriptional regulator, transcriptional repressor for nem operon
LTTTAIKIIDYNCNQKRVRIVKVTQTVKHANAAEVLKAAGRVMRAKGTGAATMANIAAQANLTHGAVYRHFNNKDDLAAAAIKADFDKIIALLEGIKKQGGDATVYINAYLATDHRDYFIWGCPIAPLASEIHRDAKVIQQSFNEGLQRNISALLAVLGPEKTREDAIAILAALSGALAIARAARQTTPELSEEILAATREMALRICRSSKVV